MLKSEAMLGLMRGINDELYMRTMSLQMRINKGYIPTDEEIAKLKSDADNITQMVDMLELMVA